jgi:hypothetical protein
MADGGLVSGNAVSQVESDIAGWPQRLIISDIASPIDSSNATRMVH